ncbi:MAG: cation:proton antiporter, partial [Planctomycetota bacterium]
MEQEITLNLPFLIAGVIIFLGFLGTLFFQKTSIPDVLLLLGIGVVLGPLTGWIKADTLKEITPYFARLALIIIIFEGGMHLNFDSLIKYFIGGMGLGVIGFLLSTMGVYLFGIYALEMTSMNSLLLGCILGGTCSSIIIPLITKMKVREETCSILSLESVLTDIFVLIGTVLLIKVQLMGEVKASQVMNALAGSFSIALVAGIIAGFIWIKALGSVKLTALSYMTTLAAALVLFSVVEMAQGSGAVAVFTFGLVLRNGTRFLRVIDTNKTFQLNTKIEEFHGEFTFFIRTYFFVYLGLLITFDLFRRYDILQNGLIISLSLIIARYLTVWLLCGIYKPM